MSSYALNINQPKEEEKNPGEEWNTVAKKKKKKSGNRNSRNKNSNNNNNYNRNSGGRNSRSRNSNNNRYSGNRNSRSRNNNNNNNYNRNSRNKYNNRYSEEKEKKREQIEEKKQVFFFLDGGTAPDGSRYTAPKNITLEDINNFLGKYPNSLPIIFYQVTKRIGEPFRDQENFIRIFKILLENHMYPKPNEKSCEHEYTPYMALAWWLDIDNNRFKEIVTLLHNLGYDIFSKNKKREDTLGSLETAFNENKISKETYRYRYDQFLNINIKQLARIIKNICADISCNSSVRNSYAQLRFCLIKHTYETIRLMFKYVKEKLIKEEYENAAKYCKLLHTACFDIRNLPLGNLGRFFQMNSNLSSADFISKINEIFGIDFELTIMDFEYYLNNVKMLRENIYSKLTEEQIISIVNNMFLKVSKACKNEAIRAEVVTGLTKCIINNIDVTMRQIAKRSVSTNLGTKVQYDKFIHEKVYILLCTINNILSPNNEIREEMKIHNVTIFSKERYLEIFINSLKNVDTSNLIDQARVNDSKASVFVIIGELARQGELCDMYVSIINHICNKESDIMPIINELSDNRLVDVLLRMVTQAKVFPKTLNNDLAYVRHNFNINMKQKFNIDDIFKLRYGGKTTCNDIVKGARKNPPEYVPYNSNINNNNN